MNDRGRRGPKARRLTVAQLEAPVAALGSRLVWLRPDVGVNVTGANVDSWVSQSGGAYSFANTGTNRPTYSANALGTGKPGVVFAAASTQTLKNAAAAAALLPGTCSVYYAASRVSTAELTSAWSSGTTANTTLSLVSYFNSSPTNSLGIGRSNTGGNGTYPGAVGANVPVVVSNIFSAANYRPYLNSVLGGTNFGTDTPATDLMVVGAYRLSATDLVPLNGAIGELLVFNAAHTAVEQAQVERYLRSKWL